MFPDGQVTAAVFTKVPPQAATWSTGDHIWAVMVTQALPEKLGKIICWPLGLGSFASPLG